jgi:hypothetical protein
MQDTNSYMKFDIHGLICTSMQKRTHQHASVCFMNGIMHPYIRMYVNPNTPLTYYGFEMAGIIPFQVRDFPGKLPKVGGKTFSTLAGYVNMHACKMCLDTCLYVCMICVHACTMQRVDIKWSAHVFCIHACIHACTGAVVELQCTLCMCEYVVLCIYIYNIACMYIFIYIYTTYTHTCIYVYVCICIYTYIYMCVCVCVYSLISPSDIYMLTHTHTHTHIYIYTYTHTYIYTCICIHIHIHIYNMHLSMDLDALLFATMFGCM